jgi:hypothetical protein
MSNPSQPQPVLLTSEQAAAFNQLHAQTQQLQQQLAQLQAQQLQQVPPIQVVAPPAPAPAPVPPPRMKLTAPSTYSGSAVGLENWLREMKQQLDYYHTTTESVRVLSCAGQLRGVALDWWHNMEQVDKDAITSFDLLAAALRVRFHPINSAMSARMALDALHQGSHSVNDYISHFRRLLTAVPTMSEEDKVHRFTQGLRKGSEAQKQLIMQEVNTLDKAIAMAARVGSLSLFASGVHYSSASPSAAPSSSAMDLSAMEVSGVEGLEQDTYFPAASASVSSASSIPPAVQAELQSLRQQLNAINQSRNGNRNNSNRNKFSQSSHRRVPNDGLTNEQRKQHLDNRTCFTCGGADHFANRCPQNKSTN